jgi:hypothetical protein
MKSHHGRLVADINTRLDTLAENGSPWIASWIANAICQEHQEGLNEGAHRDFWQYNSYKNVRRAVATVINERAGDRADRAEPKQISLPGFARNHLQDYYIVKRNGVDEGVAVTQLTDEELENKERLYLSMGASCTEHAREIRRFRKWRKATKAA